MKISKVNHCVRTLKLDAEEVKGEGKEGEGKKPDCQTMVPNLLDTTTDGRVPYLWRFLSAVIDLKFF